MVIINIYTEKILKILKITMYDSSCEWWNYKNFYYVFHMWNVVKIFSSTAASWSVVTVVIIF